MVGGAIPSWSRSAAMSRRAGRSGGEGVSTGGGLEREGNYFRPGQELEEHLPGCCRPRAWIRAGWMLVAVADRLRFLAQVVFMVSGANQLHAEGCLEGRRNDGRAGM